MVCICCIVCGSCSMGFICPCIMGCIGVFGDMGMPGIWYCIGYIMYEGLAAANGLACALARDCGGVFFPMADVEWAQRNNRHCHWPTRCHYGVEQV